MVSCCSTPFRDPIDAGVADLSDEVAAAAEHEDGRRGSHALLVHLGQRALEDGAIRLAQGAPERLFALGGRDVVDWREVARDDGHGHLAGDLARRMTAHPIGNHKYAAIRRRVGEQAVFVAGANHPDIAP